jgi:FixJ family two-component response regulator
MMIYIIEDDKSVINAFELFLESAEMEFKSYESAEDFLSLVQPVTTDMLILDLNLPGMNGRELLKNFEHVGLKIPVIVVTAHDDLTNRESCGQYGVKAFLKKPVDGEALIEIIQTITR